MAISTVQMLFGISFLAATQAVMHCSSGRAHLTDVEGKVIVFGRALFAGLFGQCAIASPRHNAVVVSMGLDLLGEGCGGVWAHTRDAIVSDPDKLPAAAPQGYGNRGRVPEPKKRVAPTREELLQLRAAVVDGTMMALTRNQTAEVNKLLRAVGEAPLPAGA